MPKIKPLGKRVLIKRSKAQATKGGILLPDTAQEKPREGEVVAVGPGAVLENGKVEPLSVKVGDRVIYSNYAGTEVKTEETDAEYLILSEDDILCIKGA